MLGFFPKVTVSITGKPDEQWSITRAGRGKTTVAINSQYQCLVPKSTKAVKGDIVTIDSEKYFVTTLESSFVNTIIKLYKANAVIDIVRVTKHMIIVNNISTNDYSYEVPVSLVVPTYFEDITGKMQQYDQGILATSTRRFLMPLNALVKLQDRVKFNNEVMQITAINTSKFPNLYEIQTTTDTRVTR